jgi:hypothetical protein
LDLAAREGGKVSAPARRWREEPEPGRPVLGAVATCRLCRAPFAKRHVAHRFCVSCWPWAWLQGADPWRNRAALRELARRARA